MTVAKNVLIAVAVLVAVVVLVTVVVVLLTTGHGSGTKPTLVVTSNTEGGSLSLAVTGFGLKPGSSVEFGFTYGSGLQAGDATVNAQGEVKKGPETVVSCGLGATPFGQGTTASGLPIKATVTGPSC